MEHQISRAKFIVDIETESSQGSTVLADGIGHKTLGRADSVDSFRVGKQLEDTFQQSVTKALDSALTRWVESHGLTQDTIVELDNLTLDLGEIAQAYNDTNKRSQTSHSEVLEDMQGYLLEKRIYEQLSFALKQKAPHTYLPHEWKMRSIKQFLQHGQWPVPQVFDSYLQAQQYLLDLYKNGHIGKHKPLQSLLDFLKSQLRNTTIWQRLFYQSDTELLQALIHSKSAEFGASDKRVSLINALQIDKQTKQYQLVSLWLICAFETKRLQAYSANANDEGSNKLALSELIWQLDDIGLSALTALCDFAFAGQAIKDEFLYSLLGQNAQKAKKGEKDHLAKALTDAQNQDSHNEQVRSEDGTHVEDDNLNQSIQVSNAGIIILHPFLASLFEQCELTIGQSFRDLHCQAIGAHLLHFLAQGDAVLNAEEEGVQGTHQVEESALLFPKYLVDWPMKQAMPKLALSDAQKAKAAELLHAAIKHWSVLKGTSVATFQSTFLQRAAILSELDSSTTIPTRTLSIEKKTPDILLEKLPWSITNIKLPWLRTMLLVDWSL
jgi:hypothetical protein